MTDLITRLKEGVPSRIERWPGNDGEDIVRDTGAATKTMQEAAVVVAELLEALRELLRDIVRGPDPYGSRARAEAAIAKAEGSLAMTGKKMDGGPALPVFDASRNLAVFGGMTLRDYFAGQAPISLTEAIAIEYQADLPHMNDVARAQVFATLARMRYEYADAMLKERVR